MKEVTRQDRIEVFDRSDCFTKSWYWRYRSSNGKIQFDGAESYCSERSVLRALNGLKTKKVLRSDLQIKILTNPKKLL